jgi:hypothetical protein
MAVPVADPRKAPPCASGSVEAAAAAAAAVAVEPWVCSWAGPLPRGCGQACGQRLAAGEERAWWKEESLQYVGGEGVRRALRPPANVRAALRWTPARPMSSNARGRRG